MVTNQQFLRLKTVVLSVAEFFYDDLRTKVFSLEERKLISDWRNLSPEMKKAVTAMIAAAQAEAKELSQTKNATVQCSMVGHEQGLFGLQHSCARTN